MERKDVVRTRKLIEDAYMELILKSGNKKITVNDIINQAGVSRSTFYAHYQDIPDLDVSVENRIIDYIKASIVSTTPEELIENPRKKTEPLLNAMFMRKEFVYKLIVGGWKPLILKKIRDAFDEGIDWENCSSIDKSKFEAINICIKGAMLEACYHWSMSDNPIDEELMIETMSDFISGGMARIVEKSDGKN